MIRTMKCAMALGVAVWMGAVTVEAQEPATLTIETDKPVAKVSPTLYGLMTEEINYSYEGGLYARDGAGPDLYGEPQRHGELGPGADGDGEGNGRCGQDAPGRARRCRRA